MILTRMAGLQVECCNSNIPVVASAMYTVCGCVEWAVRHVQGVGTRQILVALIMNAARIRSRSTGRGVYTVNVNRPYLCAQPGAKTQL